MDVRRPETTDHRADAILADGHPAGQRESWFTGLGLGAVGGFLSLEFPLLGLAICAAAAAIIRLKGRTGAGIGGLLTGGGGTWLALFGRVAIDCHEDTGCTAPGIGTAVAISAAILAVGVGLSLIAVLRSRRG